MAWHFDPTTGSPFWLRKRDELGFDPNEIDTVADLTGFPDVSDELRSVPVQDLVPRGMAGTVFRVYESGGTTGSPKRIVDARYRRAMLAWARDRLLDLGVPANGNWLHIAPTGPHVAGTDVATHAAMGGGFFHTVDFDPRWVKRLVAAGKRDVVGQYVQHLVDQAETVMATQDIDVLNATPALLEAICARPRLVETVNAKVTAILWAGMSASAETLRVLDEYFFPEVAIAGVYGNSLMGVAPQRPRLADDAHRCVFEPFPETTRIDLVDEDGKIVDYGERGRVRLHLISPEMFLPNVMERDSAVRVAPTTAGGVDGLADVQPYQAPGDAEIIEGVY
ncbi:phenazine biosynthesis protein [Actinosynnema sp. ALI-1.44]|uniref:phenazine biosynthesis protein n=1 Tax=Actinosynnema sp. ALI-1.44 TaxID=1933779 RepID=UPI00192CE570|nr:phenazine biosynthesis protein [Actinosynnema sp. ALI-1.44]